MKEITSIMVANTACRRIAAFKFNPHLAKAFRACDEAIRHYMGTELLYLREGGSIPIIGIMSQLLGMDCLMLATLRLEVSPPPPYNRIRGIFNRRTSRGMMAG